MKGYAYIETECCKFDWLTTNSESWLLSPIAYDYTGIWFNKGLYNSIDVALDSESSNSNFDVQPTVYLKSNVNISGGDGSPSNPYVFE